MSATLDMTGQRQIGHLIDGRIVRGERTFPVDAPETAKVVAECTDATPEMVDDAMAAATLAPRPDAGAHAQEVFPMAVPQSDESVDKRRMFDLTGRVALVTGAGRGMGVGMVTGLLRQGAAVVINDVNADLARERAEELAGYGPPVFAVPFDITDLAAVTSGLQRAAELVGAPVDILVNNAGIPASAVSVTPFLDIAPEDWPPYLNLNLYGSMNCIKAAAPGMVERGWGRIIQISSGAGRVGLNHGQALYGAGKSGIEGFIRHIAQEFATQGVTANSVALGLMENVKRNVEIIRPTIERIPMKRLGSMTDVGGMIAFLASEEAGYVTGQTINLNGGVYAN